MSRLRFEVIPGDGAPGSTSLAARLERAFPKAAEVTLTVTSLPQHGIGRTLQASTELAALGFRVVPHLPARGISGRAELQEILHRMTGAGVAEVFAVSGDASPESGAAGDYTTSLELIRDLVDLDPLLSIGIACYPEGHPHFSDEHLMQHLLERAPFIDTVVSQLCFSAGTVARFALRLREAGVDAAFWAGVPASVGHRRLESLSDRLGVGASKELLQQLDGDFDAARFVSELRAEPAFARRSDDSLAGIHVYTFNEIEGLPALLQAVTVNHD